ncbi:transposase [Arenibacter sp. GZD96]|nr:transposase [Arenibacter sp. GZD-96]MEA1785776.1 transposase [Arenibacter sp. GZD-96]
MIFAITNQGKAQFMIYSENMNADKFIEFMQQIIKSSSPKVYLILDTISAHRSKILGRRKQR